MSIDAPCQRIGQRLIRPNFARARRARATVLGLALAMWVAGCSSTNHFLNYPTKPARGLVTWTADFARDELKVHIEAARPPGPGPFPAVIVLPEEDETAVEMHGAVWDLAARGYVAIAADYHRLIDGKYRRNLFAWRSTGDLTLILDVTRAYPEIDQDRIGTLGFSKGAVISLLMAGHDPDRLKAVVAYYPLTDFPRWYAGQRTGFGPRLLFAVARWQMRVDADAPNPDKFETMLRLASPMHMAEYVRAPTLLIHGADDTLAFPEESERLAERLRAGGVTTEVLIVPEGRRLFNFRQAEQGKVAWAAAVEWLERYLHPGRKA